jgi:hypothetical protein
VAATSTPAPPTNTQPPTATPTEDPLRSEMLVGPRVTHVGLATSGGTVINSVGTLNGNPVFTRNTGNGFYLFVEGMRGPNGVSVGRMVQRGGTQMADLQIEVSNPVGNGSATYCDLAVGGVQAVHPPNFDFTPFIANATNDFTCGFTSTVSQSAAVTFNSSSVRAFVKSESVVQFSYLIPLSRAFAAGDTTVTVRLLDTSGNPGPIKQIVVRIG